MSADLVPIAESGPVTVAKNPMDGWYAFGCIGDGAYNDARPVVHRLGGSEQWPAPELHNGVAAIHVTVYGDGPDGAFVAASGSERAPVEAAWLKAAASIREGVGRGWFS